MHQLWLKQASIPMVGLIRKVACACRHEHWRQRLQFPAQPPIAAMPLPSIPEHIVPKKAAKKVVKRASTPKVLGKRHSSAAQVLDL